MARERTDEAQAGVEAAGEQPGDRRSSARLDKAFPVYVDGDRGGALGIARNISDGGMFVETRAPESLGSQVRVTFGGLGGEMTAVAEVRYVCHLLVRDAALERPRAVRGMGLRFLYFEPLGGPTPVLH